MRVQRVSYPSFNVPVHPALKRTPNLYFQELQKLAIEQKVRFEEITSVVLSEVEHFEKCVGEVFCLAFQI